MTLHRSTAGLIVVNGAVIGVALWQKWPLVVLLWPYWLQSLIIGWYSRKRILALKEFSLENTSGFDAGSPDETRKSTARFFVAHYGFFHLAYFAFLLVTTSGGTHGIPAAHVTPLDLGFLGALGVSFILTHRHAYARIIACDQLGRPNIGGVMHYVEFRITAPKLESAA